MSARDKDRKARERDAKKNQGRNPAHSPGRHGAEKRKCTVCDGKGYIRRWWKDKNNVSQYADTTCGNRGGKGETR